MFKNSPRAPVSLPIPPLTIKDAISIPGIPGPNPCSFSALNVSNCPLSCYGLISLTLSIISIEFPLLPEATSFNLSVSSPLPFPPCFPFPLLTFSSFPFFSSISISSLILLAPHKRPIHLPRLHHQLVSTRSSSFHRGHCILFLWVT